MPDSFMLIPRNSMMDVIVVCGQWLFENDKWMFHVDSRRGSKVIPVNDDTNLEDMINMVYEDYDLDRGHVNLELSYMLSRKSLMKLTHDTPPVKIGNFRQFQGFIRLRKSDQVRLCVEVSLRSNKKTKKTQTLMENQSDYNHDEDTNTDGERFDYCDDSDGATSDDEDFIGPCFSRISKLWNCILLLLNSTPSQQQLCPHFEPLQSMSSLLPLDHA
ncbi:hypothetical protein HID58_059100 [Brassica napus]|uniref:Uncharacterized protein n=1 Tax=Brassica napus TaxID=3708 RepID=A0ABQ7ZRY6_BRANA|nr:hypothetical protein HID58_059100 [Brassica napus]